MSLQEQNENQTKSNEVIRDDKSNQLLNRYAVVKNLSTSSEQQSDGIAVQSKDYEGRIVTNYSRKTDPNTEYGKAFMQYLRHGIEEGIMAKSQNYKEPNLGSGRLSILSKNDDGYIVSDGVYKSVQNTKAGLFPFHELATVYNISVGSLDIVSNDNNIKATWSESDLNNSESMLTGKKNIAVYPLYCQPKLTQAVLEDYSINIEEWIGQRLNDALLSEEENAFLNGNGVGQPKGILTYSTQINEVVSSAPNTITADDIIRICHSIDQKYMHNASFLMNREALKMIRTLKDKNDRYILETNFVDQRYHNSILGYPVFISKYMPDIKGGIPIIFGDFRAAYYIVYKGGIRILRDPFTAKPYVKFYTTRYVGGDLVKSEALSVYKMKS